jgi:succinoglycan biosynthesis protein ExoA
VTHRPLVTVVIPARNEARDIGAAVDAVRSQSYPREAIEVIVGDGASADETALVASEAAAESCLAGFRVIENPVATTPSNLNVGLRAARGEYICRIDARSRIPGDYIERCVEVMSARPEVSVVGGAQVAKARPGNRQSEGIARALRNPYTMGLSRYRRGAASGPSDTVYLGFFRREGLVEEGGWNEALATNQDFDLNRRMGRSGLVWFESGLEVDYVPRDTLADLFRQYQRFGRWKVRYWRTTGDRPQPRQVAMIAAPPLALTAGALMFARHPAPAVAATTAAASMLAVGGLRRRTLVTEVLAVLATAGGWTTGLWLESVDAGR